jgi:hypothetical protein
MVGDDAIKPAMPTELSPPQRHSEIGRIPLRYARGMSVQMTIRVDDEAAAFVDSQAQIRAVSRADVINAALRREARRQAAVRDAEIYAASPESDLESDAYAEWALRNAAAALGHLD